MPVASGLRLSSGDSVDAQNLANFILFFIMRNFSVRYTDTIGGQPNFGDPTKRETVSLADDSTDRQIVLACKNVMGLSGVKCDREEDGETTILRPRGLSKIMFIDPQY